MSKLISLSMVVISKEKEGEGDIMDFNSAFGNKEIDLSCPGCGHKISIRISDVGGHVICPGCKNRVYLQDDGSVAKGINDVNRALKN